MCEVNGPYSLQWYKLKDGLNESKDPETEKNRITFVIPSVTEKDDGIYVCQIGRHILKYVANDTIVVKSQGTVMISVSVCFLSKCGFKNRKA